MIEIEVELIAVPDIAEGDLEGTTNTKENNELYVEKTILPSLPSSSVVIITGEVFTPTATVIAAMVHR